MKFINIHASLLPKWRGAAPIQRAIMNLDKETGISIMKITPELDTGPYMLQEKIPIEKEDDHESLSNKLSNLGSKLIIQSLDLIEKGDFKFTEQDNQSNLCKKIEKERLKLIGKILPKIFWQKWG